MRSSSLPTYAYGVDTCWHYTHIRALRSFTLAICTLTFIRTMFCRTFRPTGYATLAITVERVVLPIRTAVPYLVLTLRCVKNAWVQLLQHWSALIPHACSVCGQEQQFLCLRYDLCRKRAARTHCSCYGLAAGARVCYAYTRCLNASRSPLLPFYLIFTHRSRSSHALHCRYPFAVIVESPAILTYKLRDSPRADMGAGCA